MHVNVRIKRAKNSGDREIFLESGNEAGLTVLLTQVGYELIHKHWLCQTDQDVLLGNVK